MARRSEGWSLYRDRRTEIYFVRFRWDDKRWNRSTGEVDRIAAQKEAARIYEAVISSARVKVGGKAPPLKRLFGEWLEAFEASHSEHTTNEYERYTVTYFIPRFGSLARMSEPALAEYMRHRLRQVKAATVKKELSALRSFFAWAVERGHFAKAPSVPQVPRRTTGTSASSQIRVDLTPSQVEALLAALPERGRERFPVRDVITLIWETSLRIATIERLRAPQHFRPGRATLFVSADIDKARYQREVPLSPRAREVLERHVSDETSGLIFGTHDCRAALHKAALAIELPEELARRVGPHDLRHAAITHFASSDGASIAGIAYLAGHKTPTMTARYVHAAKDAAERALAARSAIGTPIGTPSPIAPPTKENSEGGNPPSL